MTEEGFLASLEDYLKRGAKPYQIKVTYQAFNAYLTLGFTNDKRFPPLSFTPRSISGSTTEEHETVKRVIDMLCDRFGFAYNPTFDTLSKNWWIK